MGLRMRDSPDRCVDKLKVLADGTRLAVLETLMDGPQHVGSLAEHLDVEQSLLSHHLRVLRDAGLVDAERDGKAVRYRIGSCATPTADGRAIDLGCCRLSFAGGGEAP